VRGAAGSRHAVGANDFTGLCRKTLGQYPASGPCISLTRENTTIANTVAFDASGEDIVFDGAGNVDSDSQYLGVDPGVYRLEFEVRVQAWGVNFCPNCDVIYQAPGPYGHAALVVVP